MSRRFSAQFIKATLQDIDTYTFKMKVKDLIFLYYIAVRGKDEIEGAVQRPLSKSRIDRIKDYVLRGNGFLTTFVLNWTEMDKKPSLGKGKISFPIIPSAAQAIDGQHRLAGLEAAIEEQENVGEMYVLVTLCIGLPTQKAAEIFLNINTEQKPAPKSLLYDLFGETSEGANKELSIVRARDLAERLNETKESALYNLLKFPGAPRGVGKIELSTFVNALKPSLEINGEFSKYKLTTFEHQFAILNNFFDALKSFYDDSGIWTSTAKNPFFKAAGLTGAIEFLIMKLLPQCVEKKSFKTTTMKNLMRLDENDLLIWTDMKGLDGKTARKKISDFLERGMLQSVNKNEFEF